VKLSSFLINQRALKAYGRLEVWLHIFLTYSELICSAWNKEATRRLDEIIYLTTLGAAQIIESQPNDRVFRNQWTPKYAEDTHSPVTSRTISAFVWGNWGKQRSPHISRLRGMGGTTKRRRSKAQTLLTSMFAKASRQMTSMKTGGEL
jgi:hypothetical protein